MTKKEEFESAYYFDEEENTEGYYFNGVFSAEKNLITGEISYEYNESLLLDLNAEVWRNTTENYMTWDEEKFKENMKTYFKKVLSNSNPSSINISSVKIKNNIKKYFAQFMDYDDDDLFDELCDDLQEEIVESCDENLNVDKFELYKKYFTFDVETIKSEIDEIYNDILKFISVEKEELKNNNAKLEELTNIEKNIIGNKSEIYNECTDINDEEIVSVIKALYEFSGKDTIEEIFDDLVFDAKWEILDADSLTDSEFILLDKLFSVLPDKVIQSFYDNYNPLYDNSNLELVENILKLCDDICRKDTGEKYTPEEILKYLEQKYLTKKLGEETRNITDYIEDYSINYDNEQDDFGFGGRK